MKKLVSLLVLAMCMCGFGFGALLNAEIPTHFNMGYSTTGVPININDRYYSQDLGRDHWYGLDKTGAILKDISGQDAMIVNGGSVTQTAGTSRINITSGTVYVPYQVTVPLSFDSLPPTTTTQSVDLIRVNFSSITDLDISTLAVPALFTGATNFVKIKYLDADSSTRSYALRSGNYYYEKRASYTITVDTTPATIYEAILTNIISTATAAPMLINYSSRTVALNLVRLNQLQRFTKLQTFEEGVAVTTTTFLDGTFLDSAKITTAAFSTNGLSDSFSYGIKLQTVTITTTGGKVLILGKATMYNTSGTSSNFNAAIFRNGVELPGSQNTTQQVNNAYIVSSLVYLDTPSAGTHTYQIGVQSNSGFNFNGQPQSLAVVELRK
jgi:hypothetical protein